MVKSYQCSSGFELATSASSSGFELPVLTTELVLQTLQSYTQHAVSHTRQLQTQRMTAGFSILNFHLITSDVFILDSRDVLSIMDLFGK